MKTLGSQNRTQPGSVRRGKYATRNVASLAGLCATTGAFSGGFSVASCASSYCVSASVQRSVQMCGADTVCTFRRRGPGRGAGAAA